VKMRLTNAVFLVLVGLGVAFLTCAPAVGQQQAQKAVKPQKAGAKGQKAGPGAAQPGQQETPIHITASRLEADQQAGVILFTGNVKAVQGDSILYCDQLWVYYQTAPQPQQAGAAAAQPTQEGQAAAAQPGATPERQPSAAPPAQGQPDQAKAASPLGDMGGEKISHIVARGQVRFVQEDRVATGEEATYYKDRDEVVLVGNPQLWRGENSLKGEKIIFNLATNKVQVESSPQKRVEAYFYTAAQPGGEKGPIPFAPATQKAPRGASKASQKALKKGPAGP